MKIIWKLKSLNFKNEILKKNWKCQSWKLNLKFGILKNYLKKRVLKIKFGILNNYLRMKFLKLNLEIEVLKIIWKLEVWTLNLRIGILEIKFERNWMLLFAWESQKKWEGSKIE